VNYIPSLKKHIAILGSTGSIGTQTLEVIRGHSEIFQVELLTAFYNADALIQQAIEFKPNTVVIGDKNVYPRVNDALAAHDIKVFAGYDSIGQAVEMETIDLVVTAMVGYPGLKPTIAAINAGKQIALANKETLVIAGELVTALAREKRVNIYPIDSEHSAIFQCLQGEFHNKIEKIYLTASGGPFLGKDKKYLETVTKTQALKHPNWNMGAKITIDSATLMNKGLEMIEAKWLFNLIPEQIEVIVHPQSIIHSIVQFEDGSMKAQMGLPDMKLPIQFAIGYPQRLKSNFPRFNFANFPQLTFEKADTETFRNLSLAMDALSKGGNLPCILNAANETVVAAFLNDEIGFLQMSDIIEECISRIKYIAHPSLEDYFLCHDETCMAARELITSKKSIISQTD
jgi:1-deoxy-D-xylulose-5-phosphate reductoisomerase